MNIQEQAYIEGFVKRASEYGFSQDEAISLLKSATAADAPALQVPPTFAQGLNNVKGNLLNALRNPNNINPVNAPIMTGSAGTPARGLQGIPAMAKNLYSHISPVEGRPTFKGMDSAGDKILNNMAEGLWTTPLSKPSTVPAPQPVTPAMRNERQLTIR